MTTETIGVNSSLAPHLRTILLELARREDERAAQEAAAQRYWESCPPSVHGHLAAASVLRDRADQLLATDRPVISGRDGDE